VRGKPEKEKFKIEAFIYCRSHRDNIFDVAETLEELDEEKQKIAKKSETHLKLLFYDEKSNTSVLKCYPKTGRTHQIRVHLKHLGIPIANDVTYGGEQWNEVEADEADFRREYDEDREDNLQMRMFLRLWLHAYKYKLGSEGKVYKTEKPKWAAKEYDCGRKF